MHKTIATLILLAGFALGWSLALAQEGGARSTREYAADTEFVAHDATCPHAHGALPHSAAMTDSTASRDAASDDRAHADASAAAPERDAAAPDAATGSPKSKPVAPATSASTRPGGAPLRWQSLLPGIMK